MRLYTCLYAVLYVTYILGFGIVTADFVVSPPFNSSYFLTSGNGVSVNDAAIRLSLGASVTGGVVVYDTLQDFANGFVTEFTYQSFECDPYQWGGADGYSRLYSVIY